MNNFIKNILLRYSTYCLIIVAFYEFSFIDKCFNFFNKFHIYSIWITLVFFIVFGIFLFVKNNTKIFSCLYIWKNFLPIFIIIIVLFAQKTLSLWEIIGISFLCIMLFDCIYFILKYFISKKANKRKEIEDKIKIFNDNAEEKKDTLGREKIVENLVKLILSIERKESYAFLLSAGWGEGKSSCINFLIKKITDDELHKDLFEFIKINPWFNDTKEKLLNAILGEINYFVKTNFPYKSFESEFDDIIKLSNVKLNNYVEIALQNILENFTQDKNIQHKIKHIGEILKEEYSKKIIIILDDIDRLSKDNILFIMQTVEMFKQYTNLIFILSGDYNKIEQILCETSEPCVQENGTNISEIKKTVYYKNYIEKILNVIKLPSIEEDVIKENLRVNINEILGKENEINAERFEKYIECSRFKTLRDVKRFCNAFQISYLQVKDKINIYNFINLEILFVFYPEIYKDCLNNKEFWFHDVKIYQVKETGKIERQEKEEGEQLKIYFNDLIRNYSNYDKDILLKIISIIIVSHYNFDLQTNKSKNKEGDYSYFNDNSLVDSYFTHKLPKSNVDEDTIYNKFTEWLNTVSIDELKVNIKSYLNTLNNKEIIDFFNKIHYSDKYTKILRLIIECFSELSEKFIKVNATFIWKHIKLLLNLNKNAGKKELYKTIITKSTNVVFDIELYHIIYESLYTEYVVGIEKEDDLIAFDSTISEELDKKISNNKEKSLDQIYKLGSFDYINCWFFNKYSYAEQKNKNRDVIDLVRNHIKEYKELKKRVGTIKPLLEKNKNYFKFFISDLFKKNLYNYANNKISLESNISNIVFYIDVWGKDWLTKQIKILFEDDFEFIKLLQILDSDDSLKTNITEHTEIINKQTKTDPSLWG